VHRCHDVALACHCGQQILGSIKPDAAARQVGERISAGRQRKRDVADHEVAGPFQHQRARSRGVRHSRTLKRQDGAIGHFQVTLNVGFRLEDAR
jgi:hypothetical protein